MTVAPPMSVTDAPAQGEGRRLKAFNLLLELRAFIALIVIIVVFGLMSDAYLTWDNLVTMTKHVAINAILAIGMLMVILTGGIDLSVGSIVGFSAIAFAAMLTEGMPWPLAIMLGLAAGAVIGALNGLGVTKGGLQPFIMTLGMLVIARGVTMTYSKGQPIALRQTGQKIAWLGTGTLLGVPVPVWILLVMALLAGFTLNFTTFGRHVYAVGDNQEAARLSGINTKRVIFFVYVISGACAAMSALIIVARLTAGEPSAGTGYELDAIAIVVIGGTSLFGGEGGVRGTLIGAGIVAVLANLLNLLGVSPFSQQIVKGLIILGAVLLQRRGGAAKGDG